MAVSESGVATFPVAPGTPRAASRDGERGLASIALRRFLTIPSAVGGAVLLVALVLAAIFAPLLTPFDFAAIAPTDAYAPPSREHLMGTDKFGRDVFTRVIYGGRISLTVGLIAIAIGASIGVTVGLVAGYFGGLVDEASMRVLDVLLAFPGILLAMGVVAMLGPDLRNLMIAVGIGYIAGFARLMRGNVLAARKFDYVLAAEAIGGRAGTIMGRHILPNITAPLIVYATCGVASAILTAAGLSFLGLGAKPPSPEWGIMLSDGRETLNRAWWVSLFPGLAILVTTISINFVGDGYADDHYPCRRRSTGPGRPRLRWPRRNARRRGGGGLGRANRRRGDPCRAAGTLRWRGADRDISRCHTPARFDRHPHPPHHARQRRRHHGLRANAG
jgi:peptide/nickel transport system permease protein